VTKKTYPAYIRVKPDTFIAGEGATVAQWRAAAHIATDALQLRDIRRVVRHADALGIPDDAPLVPRLRI
jgi:hypothetical protein